MRRSVIILAAVVLAVIASAGATGTAHGWFDYEHCAFCSKWAAQPGLVAHSHDEYQKISDGIIYATFIDKGYEDEFAAAMKDEEKVMAELQSGKQLPLCDYCSKIGELMDKGARVEAAHLGDALITVYTSTDTGLVREIQAFGAQAVDELPKANAAWIKNHPESQ